MFSLKHIYLFVMVFNSGMVIAERYEHVSEWHDTVGLQLACGENNIESEIFGDNQDLNTHTTQILKTAFDKIYFTNCRFPKIPSNFDFKLYGKLRTLDLSDVELDTFGMDALRNANTLKTLIASNNRLTEVSPKFFANTVQIEELHLSKNAIQRIDSSALTSAKSLKILKLSYNQLTSVEQNCFSVPTLLTLDMSHNKLTTVHAHTFDGAINLKTLDLSYNPIGSLNTEIFSRLTNLEVVALKRTEITTIQPGTFSHQQNLISLDLSENKLVNLDFNQAIPSVLPNIESIDLSQNQLTDLIGCRNTTVPKLKVLNIRSNDFNCTYLQNLMDGLNADVFKLPADEHMTNVISIRGIGCNVLNPKQNEQPIVINGFATQQSIDKLECDILFIKYSFITIFLCTIAFFALKTGLCRYRRLHFISHREVDFHQNTIAGQFADCKNDKFNPNSIKVPV